VEARSAFPTPLPWIGPAPSSLNTAREQHTATLLANGKVLVAAGYGPLSSAELYDPGTNIWFAAAAMSTARYLHTATLLANGKVLVTGGYGNTGAVASAALYDPASNTWFDRNGFGTSTNCSLRDCRRFRRKSI
jgi:hypothetical protein